jgi:23S rRNA (uracil1939-C5)-methyltransferase
VKNNNSKTHKNINTDKGGSSLESLLHSEPIVEVEKLVVGGDALARIQYQDKSLVVFIPLAAPREKLKIKITKVEKNHLYAEIVDILEASPARREAPCDYFSSCGGCSWQHITEGEQITQKELILTDLLKKFIPEATYKLLPTVASEKNFNYRNRIQLKQLGSELGYFKKSSHQIVDINHCLIAEKEISDKILDLKKSLRPSTEIKKYELRINHLNQFEHYPISGDGEGLSFSQVNNAVNAKLVSTTVELIRSLAPQFLTELYAGAGNFSFPLLTALPDIRIESVEMNPKLTAFSTKKLTDLKLQKRLFAFTSDCESFVQRRELSKEIILLDPPRSGCSEAVIERLISADSKNLLYISCHPVFLARDLKKILTSQPQYKISYLQIFDMFPQTDHFETLVLISK